MSFHWPSVLFALPLALAALLGLFALTSRARKRLLAQFAAERLLPSLLASYSPALRRLKLILVTTGILLILFALARPQWGYDWEEKRARGVDVLFALDASKSMLAEDVLPSRLERAKLAIMDLVEKMPGNRVGLVAFAGQAFLQCPLTLDYDAFRQSLEAVDTNVIAVGGSNLAAAVAEAETALESSGNHKLVVLLTDGEDLAGEGAEAARAAEGRGVTIYTVGVGTPEGEIIPVRGADGRVDYVRDDNGQIVRSKLDAKTLASVAEVTNGFYVPLGATGEGLVQVYENGIKTLTQEALEARPQRRAIERFQWPLAFGLLLLAIEPVIGTRRPAWRRNTLAAPYGALSPAVSPAKSASSSLAILMLAGFIALEAMPQASAADAPVAHPAPAPASENPPAAPPTATAESAPTPATMSPIAAQQLFAKGDYKAAADAYGQAAVNAPQDARMKFNQGASLYRAGDFAAAADAFGQALETNDLHLQQRAYYNLGNTRFRTGQAELKADPKKTVSTWEAAVKDFQAALDLDSGDGDARYNLDLVNKLLEQLKKQLEEQEKQQQQQQDQQQNQQQQDQPNQDQQQQDAQNQQQNSQDQQQHSQNQQQQNQSGQRNQQDSPSQQQHNQSGQQGQQDQQNQSGQQNQQNGSPQQQNQNGSQESGQQQNQQLENQSGRSGSQQDQQRDQDAQNQSSSGQNAEQNPPNNQEQQNQRGQSGSPDQQENPSGQHENQPSPQRGRQQDRGQRGAQQNQPSSDRDSQRGERPQSSGDQGRRQNQPARGQDAQNANQRGQSAGVANAVAGEKKDGEGGESVAIVPGVMTREEARQVLEALKVIEKKLPASNYDATKEGAAPPPAQSYKDW